MIKGNVLGCLVFLKREVAIENPFSEIRDLSGSEDRLLTLKLKAKFPIRFANEFTYVIREHSLRSMAEIKIEPWIKQRDILYKELINDEAIIKYYGTNGVKKIISHFNTMVALKQVINGSKNKGWGFYLNTVFKTPFAVDFIQLLRMVKYSIK